MIIILKKCDMHILAPYVQNRHPICNNTSIVATNLIYTALTNINNSLFTSLSSCQYSIWNDTRYMSYSVLKSITKIPVTFLGCKCFYISVDWLHSYILLSGLDLCEIETKFIFPDQSWKSPSKRTYLASLKLNLSFWEMNKPNNHWCAREDLKYSSWTPCIFSLIKVCRLLVVIDKKICVILMIN